MKKKTIFGSLIAMLAVCIGLGVAGINAPKAHAADEKITMKIGASLRYVSKGETNGMRFSATVPAAAYKEGATYGMLIAPEDYVAKNPLDYENLFGENAVYDWAVKNAEGDYVYSGTKTRIINIAYDVLYPESNGKYVINGSILNIKEGNLARNFVGRAYVKDGENYTLADYASENGVSGAAHNTRSALEVAQRAFLTDGASFGDGQRETINYYIDKNFSSVSYAAGNNYVQFINKLGTENSANVVTQQEELADTPVGCNKAYKLSGAADNYGLFGNFDKNEFVRLKFYVKGQYSIPSATISEDKRNEWLSVEYVRQGDGVWNIFYDGNKVDGADDQFYIGINGEVCVSELLGVKDVRDDVFTVTYKRGKNVLHTEAVRKGRAATYALGGTEEIGEGYTKKFTANWFNEDDLQIADLSAITNNVTVYYGEDATIYNNHTCPNYANIMGLNKYIKADADGNITFMVRYHGGNKNFWVHQKIGGSSVNLWAEAEQWYIVTTDSASGSVYISDANGKKLAENVFDGFDVTTMLFSANEPGTTIDVAAVVVITGDEYTLEERLTIDLNATIVAGTIQSGAEDITLDLSSVYTPSAEMNAKVIVDGVEYNATISAEGIVSFANPFDISKQGEYAVKVQVGRDVINANALIVTKVVTTKEEFTALNTYAAAMNMGGYYMLGNDISVSELDAKEHQIGDASSPFVGTIDGNGHKVTVWNFYDRTYGNGPWIFNFQGVIKNISLEFKYLAKYARIIRIGNGGTLENVYLSLKKTDYGDGAFMFQQSCGKMNLKNVVVDVTEITSVSGYTIFGQATKVDGVVGGVEVVKATFTNVVVKTNSAFANSIGLENTDGVKSGIYVSFADTAATNGVDFPAEGWDNKYWTVSGENVTWKNA